MKKNWKVGYRGKDGSPVEEVFVAESRDEVFAMARRRGISVTRIEEGKGEGSPHRWRVLVRPVVWAGIGVVVIAGMFLSMTSIPKDAGDAAIPRANGRIHRVAEAIPSSPSESAPAVESRGRSLSDIVSRPETGGTVIETNGLNKMQMQRWKIAHMPPAGITNTTSQTEKRPYYQIFDHASENDIAGLLTMVPGETLVGTPSYERWFVRDFLKSLETPIVITEDDTPEQAALKREVQDVKDFLKVRHDAGEDIAAIMATTHEEYQRLSEYKDMIWELLREAGRNPNATDRDIEDFVSAANAQLEARGIAPIELGPVTRHMLRLGKKRLGNRK